MPAPASLPASHFVISRKQTTFVAKYLAMSYERKIINDPVFGFINIPKGLLYDIVRHPLLQRLTRIKQLGLSSVVYPGAQHTRFQHSLGAFYLMSEDARHRAWSVLARIGEYHCPRRIARRHFPDAHGTY